jgi:hypothetical protein
MTLQINPEQEQVVGRAIEAGLIQAADDVVELGIESIRQQLEQSSGLRRPIDADEWSREFHAWVRGHSTTTPLLSDDAISRDSIYGTRGM